ncbi:MAG TPA: clostripain-related cysteine peptidase, partial [Nannocystaceae bacterium]|nr:clostripain-related cysteine peptidase [Nannocystaceae bacterium]
QADPERLFVHRHAAGQIPQAMDAAIAAATKAATALAFDQAASFYHHALALAPAACDRPRATPPDDGPPLACEAAWTRLPPADRTYDPGRDALVTDAGNQGYASYAARVHRDRCIKPWKVMLFMAADNEDLPLHAYWNLRDLETTPGAASTAFVDVLVHLDLPGPGGLRRLHLFADEGGAPPTAEAMQAATPLTLRSPIVELRPDESAPPADALRDFLAWGERAYPSERTMVVLWGHGQGWRPRLPQEPDGVRYQEGGFVGGIAFDHHERTVIDIPSLADALAVLAAPVDVLAADACLMQTAEVDLALADVARYLVGYEPIAPYPGLPYRLLLPALDDPPIAPSRCPASDPACHLAERIPALYQGAVASGHYSARAPADQVDRTYAISSIAAAPLRARLLPALGALVDALDAWLRDDPFRAIDVQGLLAPSGLPAFLGGTRDLGEVAIHYPDDYFPVRLPGSKPPVLRALSRLLMNMRWIKYIQRVERVIGRIPETAQVVDVGCGLNDLLR